MSPSSSQPHQQRPATIAELAERALDNLWDEKKPLKHYLRVAERHRREGKDLSKRGDLENAFVEFAKAATIVLEKLPSHRDYRVLLNSDQRRNLTLNGHEILDSLSDLKPLLLERHERWSQLYPDGDRTPEASQNRAYDEERVQQRPTEHRYDESRTPGRDRDNVEQRHYSSLNGTEASKSRAYEQVRSEQQQRQLEHRYDESGARGKEREPRNKDREHRDREREHQEQRRIAAEELERWRQTREEVQLERDAEERERQQTASRASAATPDRRKGAKHAARYVASEPQNAEPEYAIARPSNGIPATHAQSSGRTSEDLARAASRSSSAAPDRKKEVAMTAVRYAASQSHHVEPENAYSRAPNGIQAQPSGSDHQRAPNDPSRYQKQQEEMRQREEEILRKREEKRRQEKDGIIKRQQEAEDAARAVRHHIAVNNTGLTVNNVPSPSVSTPSTTYTSSTASSLATTPSSFYATTPTQASSMPSLDSEATGSRPLSMFSQLAPSIMPLESPSRYEGDSTDSESVTATSANNWRHKQKQVIENSRTPTRAPARSPSYPPPVTTTSPPPVQGSRVLYPQLMSQHQKRQGYYPSLNSMFGPQAEAPTNPSVPASLFFVPDSSKELYPQSLLPRPSSSAKPNPPYPYSAPPPPHMQHQRSHSPHPPPSSYPSYPGPSRPPPPVPDTAPTHSRKESERILRTANPIDAIPTLRTVSLPRECLPRFLTLAKANTDMNMETCGLLLGRVKGVKFMVTTLLIPKQHSTSDTCTMDEEELVMQFTEERNLITLGWIHTHPSQSCFMSSVDLHTHSGFQRMLPESFAVVCAPKSTPNFGIFRLTDPPGLTTVLECTAKEAFHPHPDLPIYTDADKGHVQMKDISLEIVDLR